MSALCEGEGRSYVPCVASTWRDVARHGKGMHMYDMKNLSKFPRLGELAPEAFKAFVAFDEAVVRGGVVPLKYKELIAIGVALTTQCPYCIEIHQVKARRAGASDQEIAETVLIAAALRAGGAMTHGTHALE